MFTVEAQAQARTLLEVYRSEYQARYGQPALITDEAGDRTILTDLVKKVGDAFARNLIRQYLKMNGEGKEGTWFVDHGHTLQVLQKNLATVHAALSLNQKQTSQVIGYNPVIEFESRCPRCEAFFILRCRGIDAHRHAYTQTCPSCDDKLASA